MLDKAKLLNWIETNDEAKGFWGEGTPLEAFDNLTDAINLGSFGAPLTEEVRQLREELDEYKKLVHEKHDELSKTSRQLGKEIERCCTLEKERDKLVKALEFYADEATYDIDHLGKHGYIIIDKDGGQRARNVLSEIKGQGDDDATGS